MLKGDCKSGSFIVVHSAEKQAQSYNFDKLKETHNMKVRIINRRLIFQNNGVGCGIALAMYNISYMHARTHRVLHNQVSDVESTTFSTFKVVVIIKLVCAVSYINVEFPVYISG